MDVWKTPKNTFRNPLKIPITLVSLFWCMCSVRRALHDVPRKAHQLLFFLDDHTCMSHKWSIVLNMSILFEVQVVPRLFIPILRSCGKIGSKEYDK